jgi:FAD/FMN-containing dehydrogenase
MGLADVEAVGAVVGHLRRERGDIQAIELVSRPTLELVAALVGRPVPIAAPWALLVQFGGQPSDLIDLAGSIDAALAQAGAAEAEVLVADDVAGIRELWAWRDQTTDAVAAASARLGAPAVKLDVSLPTAAMPRFVAQIEAAFAELSQGLYLFGHVGDGNLHVNFVSSEAAELENFVYEEVSAAGGSISAEHGIGRAKARWLALARTPSERSAMQALKTAWDPEGRLGRAIW